MMALTQGGRLDYFGQNVELALAIAAATPPATVSVTQAVCQDVAVSERLLAAADQLGMQQLPTGGWVQQLKARRGDARALPAPGAAPTMQ